MRRLPLHVSGDFDLGEVHAIRCRDRQHCDVLELVGARADDGTWHRAAEQRRTVAIDRAEALRGLHTTAGTDGKEAMDSSRRYSSRELMT